ncbi:MAG: prepilin peptidase [Phycisphaerales bacterium]|nr:prepilin peptidase [Phycisphaerales bacterium]
MTFIAEHYWELTLTLLIPAILYASWIDFAERRVPNWLNALIAITGLTMQAIAFGWYTSGEERVLGGVGWGLLGLLVGFGVLIVPWAMHGMGAGDVKLMAAIGCWLGPWLTLVSFAAGAVIGGLAAVVMIYSTGRTVHAITNMQTILTKMRRWDTAFGTYGGAKTFGVTSQLLPYGVPLTAGTIAVLLTWFLGGWLK